jgi:Tfp pilus assembly protein PilO
MLAGMAVSAAEPSGLLGALKEAIASSSALARTKSDAASNELIKAVVSDFETREGRAAVQEALRQQLAGVKKPGEVVERSLANLNEVSDILNAKAPQDAAGFKVWLQTISENVAEASSEGGFR